MVANQISLLEIAQNGLRVRSHVVVKSPADIEGWANSFSISSVWERKITLGGKSKSGALAITAEIQLPFSPRLQLYLPEHQRLLVADAFEGKIAIIDPQARNVLAVRDFEIRYQPETLRCWTG